MRNKDDEEKVEVGEGEKIEVNVEEKGENDEEKKVNDDVDEEVASSADSEEKGDERCGVGTGHELSSPGHDEATLLDDVVSSIVRDVQARHDRMKKMKDEDFVTPPGTTTPSKRYNIVARIGRAKYKKEKMAIDSSDASLEMYRGRADYKGQSEISKKEQQVIETYLSRDDLSLLEKRNKKRTIKIDKFPDFIAEMRSSPRKMLEELTIDVMNKARFIIIPLHSHNHWFLFILDTLKKKFIQMNSLWSAQTKGTTKVFAKFLSGYLYYSL